MCPNVSEQHILMKYSFCNNMYKFHNSSSSSQHQLYRTAVVSFESQEVLSFSPIKQGFSESFLFVFELFKKIFL